MFKVSLVCLALISLLPVHAEDIYGKVYETLKGKIYANTRVVLIANPNQETITAKDGSFWFRGVKPGAYLVQILISKDDIVTGRLIVYPRPMNVINLDLSKIEAPGHGDEY